MKKMRKIMLCVMALAALIIGGHGMEVKAEEFTPMQKLMHGIVDEDITVTEDVTIANNIYIKEGCTLRIESSLTVNGDLYNHGIIEIIGTLQVNGTTSFVPDLPIPSLSHTWDAGTTKNPSCLTDGSFTQTCTVCNAVKAETIPKLGHNYVDIDTPSATCTEDGYVTQMCTRCDSLASQFVPATGHEWDDGTVTTEAACVSDGVKTFHCLNCDSLQTKTIEKTGQHTLVWQPAASGGKDAFDLKCSVCGENYGRGYKAADGLYYIGSNTAGKHDVYDQNTVFIRTEDCSVSIWSDIGGTHDGICKCHALLKEGASHDITQSTQPAIPTAPGSIRSICTTCGAVLEDETIASPNTVNIKSPTAVYNGKSKKPSVTVMDTDGRTIDKAYYTVTYSNNKKVGTSSIKVTFKGDRYSGTLTKTFRILPRSTRATKVSASKRALKIKWKKQGTQTTGYEIQLATDKKFTKNVKKVNVKKNKTTFITVKKLRSKKKYYVRIRTYKTANGKKYCSGWTIYKKVIRTK
ncbi:MAG: fibronectin type III domain-containing protein [Lachnospiraceae bacterium]|nr:fibronectin type III domain-containing protein [Lachnospiraceae bacterium]